MESAFDGNGLFLWHKKSRSLVRLIFLLLYPVGSLLTTYRFAGIMSERATNEVSDGTVEGGLAWMVAMVNQINLLWIRELSFRLEMVEESDQLIFTNNNPAPDVFQQDPSCHSSGDPKYCELEEVKPYLESIIGPGGDDTPQNERTWEYGAHFDTRYNGGVAYMPGSTSTNNANLIILAGPPTYAICLKSR